ncbi:hypothetical protein MRX96_007412 [Rhipicephalus microplus]
MTRPHRTPREDKQEKQASASRQINLRGQNNNTAREEHGARVSARPRLCCRAANTADNPGCPGHLSPAFPIDSVLEMLLIGGEHHVTTSGA